jgi:hypothetical protein
MHEALITKQSKTRPPQAIKVRSCTFIAWGITLSSADRGTGRFLWQNGAQRLPQKATCDAGQLQRLVSSFNLHGF